jgi:photoactive yellow protein
MTVSFDQPDLGQAVEALTEQVIDRLPFGAIRLSRAGVVQFYSEAERRQSGSGDEPRLGLDFFEGVAPCMDTPEYRGRIDQAIAEGSLDLCFDYVGDFDDRSRELEVRIQSATGGGYWIFLRRSE